MKIKSSVFCWILLALVACQPKGKSEIAAILGINEPEEWILVIHPEGCKTCLDEFYYQLEKIQNIDSGAIVILSKNTKSLRAIPLISNSPLPLYLDEKKKLIKKNLINKSDQIILFKNNGAQKFDILNYQKVFNQL